MQIENVHVGELSRNQMLEHCSLGCTIDGFRYHVWLDARNAPFKLDQQFSTGKTVLYKNPPAGTKYKGAGYFDTRYLDATAKKNQVIVQMMIDHAVKHNLFGEAVEKFNLKRELEEQENRVAYIARCKREAGVELYAALEGVLHHNSAVKPEYKLPQSLVEQITKALDQAKPQ